MVTRYRFDESKGANHIESECPEHVLTALLTANNLFQNIYNRFNNEMISVY